jgi:hypothetical protein
MAQRDCTREPAVVVDSVVFEPSRVARECLARAYSVAVPPARRQRALATGAGRPRPGGGTEWRAVRGGAGR